MDEKNILVIAFVCAIAGLALMYVAPFIDVTNIGSISMDDVGRGIKVCGTIDSKRVSNNHIFLDLHDITGKIKLVIFNNTALSLNKSGNDIFSLSKGEEICSLGVVDEYPKGSNELELVYRSGNIGRV